MFKSIRWKLISIHFVLVFVSMAIVGLFITNQLQQYNISSVQKSLTSASNNLVNESIRSDMSVVKQQYDLQQTLMNTTLPAGYEISVIDMKTGTIVASTNENLLHRQSMDEMNIEVLLALSENPVATKTVMQQDQSSVRFEHIAFAYPKNSPDDEGYIIYGRASLEKTDEMLNHANIIFLNATLIVLLVTILLGYVLSTSITAPINDLKKKAIEISKGDFSQRATIHSNDEIGQLATSFNYLTERLHKTLMEISSEQDKLNAIIEHMEDGLIAIDQQGKIIHYNIVVEKLLDISMENKQYFDQIFLPMQNNLSLKQIVQQNSEMNEGMKPSEFTIEINSRILSVSSALFSDSSNTLTGYVVLFQDITEHERLDHMRKEFVANVSHELKTPITTIRTYSETLLDGALKDPAIAKKFMEVIVKESDRMTSLIRDLLQLSHIDFKKETWNFDYTDINTLVQDSIDKMELYYQTKHQTLVSNLLGQSRQIWVDKTKMEQVIINILSNAIKYTEENGKISLSLFVSEGILDIVIEDNGIGIPKEDVEHIFDRFYRVDKGRSRQQGGTGLGLSIAKHIVEEHGGSISVRSAFGKGTVFTISLPIEPKKV